HIPAGRTRAARPASPERARGIEDVPVLEHRRIQEASIRRAQVAAAPHQGCGHIPPGLQVPRFLGLQGLHDAPLPNARVAVAFQTKRPERPRRIPALSLLLLLDPVGPARDGAPPTRRGALIPPARLPPSHPAPRPPPIHSHPRTHPPRLRQGLSPHVSASRPSCSSACPSARLAALGRTASAW